MRKPNLLILIGFLLLIFLFLIGCTQPNSQSNFNSQAQPEKNCRNVQVPYEAQEEYTDTEPYETVECNQKELKSAIDENECDIAGVGQEIKWAFGGEPDYKVTCEVHNLDDEGGKFNVKMSVMKQDGTWTYWTMDDFIAARDTSYLAHTFNDVVARSCKCELIGVPTKQVCENVVKYRDVTKYRTTTKYKTEQQCD